MSGTKTKIQFDGKYIARLAITLLLITAVAALLLSVVYSFTKPTIEAKAEEARQRSMSAVMAEATNFSPVQYADKEGVAGVDAAYKGVELVGYCVQTTPAGFGGDISLMVGVSTGGKVTGVYVLSHSETPNLGTKAMTPEFLAQFEGTAGGLTVKTGAATDIDHISGATVSSTAITTGVNLAVSFIAEGGVTE